MMLVLAASIAMVSLGQWQGRRADEKRVLAARFEAAAHGVALAVPAGTLAGSLAFKPLRATGVFLPQFTILLDNKVYHGRPGYYVVTPMRLAGGPMHVLVNRGWVAAGPSRAVLPEVKTPQGEITLEGLGLEHAPRVLAAGEGRPAGTVWQNVALQDFATWSGLALQPVFLEQHSELADGLVRDWPRADFGIERHVSYAIQWYLMAAVAVAIFLGLGFERAKPASR
ncbi:MAG: SURF1 family protein [Betaproteobacteria bacterium]